MTVSLKENRKYIIAAVLCFLVIPHIPQLCFPEFYQAIRLNSRGYTPMGLSQQFDNYWMMFLVHNYCIYIIPPIFSGILGLVHVRHEGAFCPVLSTVAFLSVPTFLLWDANPWAAASVLVSAVGMTLVDLVGLLSRFDGDAPETPSVGRGAESPLPRAARVLADCRPDCVSGQIHHHGIRGF